MLEGSGQPEQPWEPVRVEAPTRTGLSLPVWARGLLGECAQAGHHLQSMVLILGHLDWLRGSAAWMGHLDILPRSPCPKHVGLFPQGKGGCQGDVPSFPVEGKPLHRRSSGVPRWGRAGTSRAGAGCPEWEGCTLQARPGEGASGQWVVAAESLRRPSRNP